MLEIEGTLRRLVFEKAEFAIARIELANGELTTAVGALAGLRPGEKLRLEGQWETHARFGQQFRATIITPIVPATADGIERYLGSGLIKGIGPKLAERIVERFGAATLEVIEKQPERLEEVAGLGSRRRIDLVKTLGAKKWARDALVYLQGHGLGPAMAARVVKHYGEETTTMVRRNPYRLAEEVDGVGFATADRIARAAGLAVDAPERLESAILHALGEAVTAGHLFLPREQACARAAELCGLEADSFILRIDALLARERVVVEGDAVYLPAFYQAEITVAQRLRVLVSAARPTRGALRNIGELSDQQQAAVQASLAGGVVVVTGGPGTGKTTLTNALVATAAAAGKTVLLCAPTGRAAKRLSEATGCETKTIHRLLEFHGDGFRRGRSNPLEADFVVVDEVSMVDVPLARRLIEAIPDGTTLVLVGDADQLPSVGPGAFLADVATSGAVVVVRLTQVFRQAEQSGIVRMAHRIRAGQMPQWDGEDVYFVKTDEPAIVKDRVVEAVIDRIPKRFGFDPARDVQVISPMHRGDAGVIALNAALREKLGRSDGPALRIGDRLFRVGDKVMQIRNNYQRDVYNGDVGFVVSVDEEEGTMMVDMDGREVAYEPDDAYDLDHAWAVTVHKSQGGESPAVVLALAMQHYPLLQRNLVYTAITRARRLLVVVGSQRALGRAISNANAAQRHSRLRERLSAMTRSAYLDADS